MSKGKSSQKKRERFKLLHPEGRKKFAKMKREKRMRKRGLVVDKLNVFINKTTGKNRLETT